MMEHLAIRASAYNANMAAAATASDSGGSVSLGSPSSMQDPAVAAPATAAGVVTNRGTAVRGGGHYSHHGHVSVSEALLCPEAPGPGGSDFLRESVSGSTAACAAAAAARCSSSSVPGLDVAVAAAGTGGAAHRPMPHKSEYVAMDELGSPAGDCLRESKPGVDAMQ
jgi:hypothetical protein